MNTRDMACTPMPRGQRRRPTKEVLLAGPTEPSFHSQVMCHGHPFLRALRRGPRRGNTGKACGHPGCVPYESGCRREVPRGRSRHLAVCWRLYIRPMAGGAVPGPGATAAWNASISCRIASESARPALRCSGMAASPTSAPRSAPSTMPLCTFSPPVFALARSPRSMSSWYLPAKWINDGYDDVKYQATTGSALC